VTSMVLFTVSISGDFAAGLLTSAWRVMDCMHMLQANVRQAHKLRAASRWNEVS
jgi:hypothetical protein